MKIIVTGASGFVGSYFHDLYGMRGDRVIGTSHKKLSTLAQIDLTQGNVVERLVKLEKPDLIVHCAAMPNVDACEEDPVASYGANVIATQNLAKACSDVGSRLVFLSSDYVFNGRDRPEKGYSEEDAPDPLNIYGKHKLEAEGAVLANPRNLVIRTTIVYGWDRGIPRNFFHTLVNDLQQKRQRKIPSDQYGSPTYVRDLVAMTDELARQNCSGIYNVAGPKIMNRYQFAMSIAWVFNSGDYSLLEAVMTNPELDPELSSHPELGKRILKQKAQRGLHLGLDVAKASGITLHRPLAPLEALVKLKKEGR